MSHTQTGHNTKQKRKRTPHSEIAFIHLNIEVDFTRAKMKM